MEQSCVIRQQVRVLLVDHSNLVLQGLQATLSGIRHIVIVGTATSLGQAGALLETCRPDVVVLEIHVGRSSGIDFCRAIRKSYPHIAVLFFTANDDKRFLRFALLAGAQGYLLKKASGQAVARAIKIVAAGRAIVDQQLTSEILTWIRERMPPAQYKKYRRCSGSDLRVLSLIAAGKSNREIAKQLNVLPGELVARIRRIYRRLEISRKSEAASYFARLQQEDFGDATRSVRTNSSSIT